MQLRERYPVIPGFPSARRLLKPLRSVNVLKSSSPGTREKVSWKSNARSSAKSVYLIGSACLFAGTASPSFAQVGDVAKGPNPPSGLSAESVQSAISPVTWIISQVIYVILSVWNYIMDHPPAAVILSTLIASYVAVASIRTQRATTRLRETFAALNEDNWDNDVIAARRVFTEVIRNVEANIDTIARYCDLAPISDSGPESEVAKAKSKTDADTANTLKTILNHYENMALAVRKDIVDEEYLFRWTRSVMLRDWDTLAPLVNAYRHQRKNQAIYIEYEGLVNAWSQDLSYRTARDLKRPKRWMSVS
jgi:hypothetical protein